jgi:hypothetical protein
VHIDHILNLIDTSRDALCSDIDGCVQHLELITLRDQDARALGSIGCTRKSLDTPKCSDCSICLKKSAQYVEIDVQDFQDVSFRFTTRTRPQSRMLGQVS